MLLCVNRHFTGVTVTFYRCFGRFTGFDRDGHCTLYLGKDFILNGHNKPSEEKTCFLYLTAKET